MEDYSLMEIQQLKQTKFDSMVTNRTMQLVKAVIPYINNQMGNFIGAYIKLIELQNATRINTNVAIAAMNADKHMGMENMLDDIKDFLGDEERETIDTIMSMMEMMNMDDDAKQDFMGSYMDMFGL